MGRPGQQIQPEGVHAAAGPLEKYKVSHKTRLLKFHKFTFHIIFQSLSSLSGSGIFFNFEKRESFMGNPVSMVPIFRGERISMIDSFPHSITQLLSRR